jgi:phenylacetate-CoA ligase
MYEGGVLGRSDDMKLVRGTNVYPRSVESIVRQYDAVSEFQIRITRTGIRDEIALEVELAEGSESARWPELAADIGRDLAAAHEGLRFVLELAVAGSLPRSELKARRLVDLRPVEEAAHVG